MAEDDYVESQLADFGIRLKSLRASREWTLEELAERSGLSKTFLSRFQADDRQPSISAVLTLAPVFAVPVGSMFKPAAGAWKSPRAFLMLSELVDRHG